MKNITELLNGGTGLADALAGAADFQRVIASMAHNLALLTQYTQPYQRGMVIVSDAAHITQRNPSPNTAIKAPFISKAIDIRAYNSNTVDMMVQIYDKGNTPLTDIFTLGPGDRVSIPIAGAFAIDCGGQGGALNAWEAIWWA